MMAEKGPKWDDLNDFAVVHQNEYESPDDWTRWEEAYAEIQALKTGDGPNLAGNRAGLAPIRVSGDEGIEFPPPAKGSAPIQEEELLPIAISNPIRRMGRVLACSWLNHAWVITYIDYLDIDTPPESAKTVRVMDMSGYLRPRVIAFSLQCVRCGRVGREEMVQATTLPPEVEEVGQEPIPK
jgi:hypothetical protein